MPNKLQQEYNQDFYAWTLHNAKLMRQGKFSEIDVEHIAEEIESMGRGNRRELVNRLALLMAHLLKWQYQPNIRGRSWVLTIKEQRIQIRNLLEESPSLKHELELKIMEAYEVAIIDAAKETGLSESTFPDVCQFTLDQCLDQHFLPE